MSESTNSNRTDSPIIPINTATLDIHTDEIWQIQFSHDGSKLASASRDKTAVIWQIGSKVDSTSRKCSAEFILLEHSFAVGCVAWSFDDSKLATSSENEIMLWDTTTGASTRVGNTMHDHQETVTALAWLQDNSGLVSGGLDRKITVWNSDGTYRLSWSHTLSRIIDLVITPDNTRLVTIGMHYQPRVFYDVHSGSLEEQSVTIQSRLIVYDMVTKEIQLSLPVVDGLTSIHMSQDSQHVIISHSPDGISLLDLHSGEVIRRFTGFRLRHHLIRSCFGGSHEEFVVSGSEDGRVHMWHTSTGAPAAVLPGHGDSMCNSVAWNPTNVNMFASCGDDRSVRIWEIDTLPRTSSD